MYVSSVHLPNVVWFQFLLDILLDCFRYKMISWQKLCKVMITMITLLIAKNKIIKNKCPDTSKFTDGQSLSFFKIILTQLRRKRQCNIWICIKLHFKEEL